MKSTTHITRIALLALPLAIGCSTTQGTFRAQTPGCGPADSCGSCQSPGQAMPAMPHGQVMGAHGFAAPMMYGGDPLHPRWDSAWMLKKKPAKMWYPTHHHTYDVKMPKNLVFPPENQQPAMVQYPYYTVKGPTDFFYKGN